MEVVKTCLTAISKIYFLKNSTGILKKYFEGIAFQDLLVKFVFLELTLSWRRSLSYKNQSIDLLCNSLDWFQYDMDQWKS